MTADPNPFLPGNNHFRKCLKGHVDYSASFDECPSCKIERNRTSNLDLTPIRERDAASAETWFKGPQSATAMAIRDRRALLAELNRRVSEGPSNATTCDVSPKHATGSGEAQACDGDELCPEGPSVETPAQDQERGWFIAREWHKHFSRVSRENAERRNRLGAGANSPQAPIARINVFNDRIAGAKLYAPGLPEGEHDLYCEPIETSWAPAHKVGDRVGIPRRHDTPEPGTIKTVLCRFDYEVLSEQGKTHWVEQSYLQPIPSPEKASEPRAGVNYQNGAWECGGCFGRAAKPEHIQHTQGCSSQKTSEPPCELCGGLGRVNDIEPNRPSMPCPRCSDPRNER